MLDQLLKKVEEQMRRAIDFFAGELKGVRSNRAASGLVDTIKVEVYGQTMMIKQIATINTPDTKTIVIQPWDKANLIQIERAIREAQGLGLSPASDGHVVRINIPALTEERRAQLVKLVSEKLEATNITLRNLRHDTLNEAKKQLKNKQITEDDFYSIEQELNKLIEKYHKEAQSLFDQKQKEMMAI